MMKKILFSLFFIFSLLLPLSAQVRLGNFSQKGAASQDMKDEGFAAAHPSLPLNTAVKVTNSAGKEVEVKITNRIGVSSSRIIDLSAAAYNALGLKAGDIVTISIAPSPPKVAAAAAEKSPTVELPPPPPAAPVPVAAAPPEPAPVAAVATAPSSGRESAQNDGGFSGYPMPPSSRSGDAEFLAWMMAMSMESRDAREAREDRDIRQGREERLAREEREAREAREARNAREEREARDAREARIAREDREVREVREARIVREERDAREAMQARIAREEREARERANLAAVPPKNEPVQLWAVAPQPVAPPPPASVYEPVQPRSVVAPPPRYEPSAPIFEPEASPPPPVPKKTPKSRPAASTVTQDTEKPLIPVRTVEPARAYPAPVKPEDVKIVPDLPDRNSNKLFRLQIGAYSAQNTAIKTAEYVKAAGFEVELEAAGSVYRVVVTGIASTDVYYASMRLGALGFGQIWVRE